MKKLLVFLFSLMFCANLNAQRIFVDNVSIWDDSSFPNCLETPYSSSVQQRYSAIEADKARRRDYVMALVPGAVQLRRDWPVVAGTIWGGMAIAGGLAAYEQIHIVNLQHKAENDSYYANLCDEMIRKSKKIRNGSLFALGGLYVANYVSALLLPDNSDKSGFLGFNTDPYGAIMVTYAFSF